MWDGDTTLNEPISKDQGKRIFIWTFLGPDPWSPTIHKSHCCKTILCLIHVEISLLEHHSICLRKTVGPSLEFASIPMTNKVGSIEANNQCQQQQMYAHSVSSYVD